MWEGDGASRLEYYTVVHPNPGHGGWASTPGVSPMAPSAATRAVSSLTSPGPPRHPSSRVRSGVPVEPLHVGSTGRSHYSPRACPATSQRGSGGGRGPRSVPPGVCVRRLVAHAGYGVRGTRPGPLWVPFQGSCPSRRGRVTLWVPPIYFRARSSGRDTGYGRCSPRSSARGVATGRVGIIAA